MKTILVIEQTNALDAAGHPAASVPIFQKAIAYIYI